MSHSYQVVPPTDAPGNDEESPFIQSRNDSNDNKFTCKSLSGQHILFIMLAIITLMILEYQVIMLMIVDKSNMSLSTTVSWFTHSSNNQSSINQTICPPINQTINQPIIQPTVQPITQQIIQPINQSINQTMPPLILAMSACGESARALTLPNIKSWINEQAPNIPYHFYIFSDDSADLIWLNESTHKWPKRVKELPWQIEFINIKEILTADQLKNVNQFHRCACIRLFLADLVPASIDRLLYVDADTLMLGNIHSVMREMTATRHPSAFLGATSEISVQYVKDNRRSWYSDKTYPWPRPFGMNSGVLILHLHILSSTRFTERRLGWNEHVTEIFDKYNGQFALGDQDLLNVVMSTTNNSYYHLPDGFNLRFGSAETQTAGSSENELVILHGNGGAFNQETHPFYGIHQFYKKLWEW